MRAFLSLTILLFPTAANAHEGNGVATGWTFDPYVVAPMLIAGGLYAAGVARLWSRVGAGRALSRTRVATFAAGFVLAGLLLLSPLDGLADRLLSAHMIQHFGLMLVAAPLLVLGRPGLASLWAFPPALRPVLGRLGAGTTGRLWRAATHPLGAWAIYFAVLWAWHVPAIYQRALAHEGIHALQHASFLGAALLFWIAVLHPARGEGRAGAFIVVFATAVQSCALAALLTTSQALWYPAYANGTGAWGLSPMEDQQLGGLIMWVPCCAILLGAAIAVFAGLLRDAEVRAERATS
ncbi:Cytochrome c oxidase assembly factor CtaG [Palleronia marisminoris]|uniref:cytochrome c oxidase assembly protein n=1 Tax=Palleronia marisminoris TaxID=315423 RepID=UPI0008E8F418|nr:cytochrome c oxidase assembly protein [Palleronia marisminoris]SFH26822.1 Cytochrome c oxidase assembly factor CtaG [Palleronia marisminoris]